MRSHIPLAAYASCGSGIVVLPTLLLGAQAALMRSSMALPEATLGILVGSFFAASAVAAYPAGRLIGRLGSAVVVRMALGVCAVALCGVGAFAASPWHVASLLAAAGVANAGAQIGLNQMIAQDVDPSHHGALFGLKQASVPFAAMAAGLSVPTLGLTFGWRSAFIAAAFMAGALAVVLPPSRPPRRPQPKPGSLAITPTLKALALAGTFAAMTITASSGFLVSWGVEIGWSAAASGALLAIGSAVGIAARIFLGWWADQTQTSVFAFGTILLAAGAVGLALVAMGALASFFFLLGTFLTFAGTWSWPGLLWLGVTRTWPVDSARPMAFVAMGPYLGGVAGPVLFGLAASSISYSAAWIILAMCAISGAIAFDVARRANGPSERLTTGATQEWR